MKKVICFFLFFICVGVSTKLASQYECHTAKNMYLWVWPCENGSGVYAVCWPATGWSCDISSQSSCGGGTQ
jgi:hypothetical protein